MPRGRGDTVGHRSQDRNRRHIPGTFRIGEDQGPGLKAEPQRLSVYLPEAVLDRAEQQANQSGLGSVQRYCEVLLLRP